MTTPQITSSLLCHFFSFYAYLKMGLGCMEIRWNDTHSGGICERKKKNRQMNKAYNFANMQEHRDRRTTHAQSSLVEAKCCCMQFVLDWTTLCFVEPNETLDRCCEGHKCYDAFESLVWRSGFAKVYSKSMKCTRFEGEHGQKWSKLVWLDHRCKWSYF